MMNKSTIFYLTVILLSVNACAEENFPEKKGASKTEQPLAAPLQYLESDGVKIGDSFAAPGGLTGYIGHYNGQPIELYLTQDKKHVLVGTLIDSDGNRISADRLSEANGNGIQWEELEATHWIAEGDANAENIVYVFTDPNCPYCAMFWEQAQPYLERGGVQLRHIMVGMLRPSSMGKAATIMAADDPAAALAEHERTMKQGGIEEKQDIPEEIRRQVMENTQFMRANGIPATPVVIFKDATGRIQQARGVPTPQMMSEHIFRN